LATSLSALRNLSKRRKEMQWGDNIGAVNACGAIVAESGNSPPAPSPQPATERPDRANCGENLFVHLRFADRNQKPILRR
jgi:hypothetical protein